MQARFDTGPVNLQVEPTNSEGRGQQRRRRSSGIHDLSVWASANGNKSVSNGRSSVVRNTAMTDQKLMEAEASNSVARTPAQPNTTGLPKPLLMAATAHFSRQYFDNTPTDQMNRDWGAFISGAAAHKQALNVDALVQHVLREAYSDQTKDLRFFAEKVKFYNQLKKRIRDHLNDLRNYHILVREWEVENNRELGDAWLETETDSRSRQMVDTTEQVVSRRVIRRSDPLILDLDGDGVEITRDIEGPGFMVKEWDTRDVDVQNNNFTRQSGNVIETVRRTTTTETHTHHEQRFKEWVGADDGLLVMDRNGDGQIQAEDMFGDESVTGRDAANGFEDLKALDTNGDGVVNSQDEDFGNLRVWQDRNSDGRVDDGEMMTLAEAGVAEVRTAYDNTGDDVLQQMGTFKSTRAVELEAQMNEYPPEVRNQSDIDDMPNPNGPGAFTSVGSALNSTELVEAEIKKFEEKLSTVGDDAQLANIDLQNMLQKQQQNLQMMSNISKMLHDTAMNTIRKIGG